MSKLQLVFLDFETFWSTEHSLTKMSPIEYVLSPLTEIQSCSIKVDDAPTDVIFGEDKLKHIFGKWDWSNKLVVAHNMSGFDSMILAWRFGIKPAMWGCTLAMARPKYAKTVGLSLAKLAAHFDIGRKDSTALVNTKGRYLADFTNAERAAMEVYNRDDTEMCAKLFHKLKPDFSAAELWHLDCNIRMLVEAEFELDKGLLQTALSVERSNKHKALLDVAKLLRPKEVEPCYDGADPPDPWDNEVEDIWSNEEQMAEWVRLQMASAPKFAALLESLGCEVPVKRSPTNPTVFIPALAKTDEAMTELLEHDDSRVAAAARARLSTKSTQLETRIQSFLDTYDAVGKLPVPVNYCGADTTGRDSGWLYNMLNLPRVNPDRPRVADALRNSVLAPEGKVIFVADLSGIELRVNHTLWKVARSMNMWAEKPNADLYRDTAAHMYAITPEEVAKPQRHHAKVIELAAGFGIGGDKYRDTARVQGGLKLSKEAAHSDVKFWRSRYPEISDFDTGGWGVCDRALNYIAEGVEREIDPWGLCHTEKDAIRLPSGRRIHYPNLRQELKPRHRVVDGKLQSKMELTWVYASGRHEAYLYGGKVDENIVQALARDVLFPNALEFWKITRLRPKHKVYDELVYLAPPDRASEWLALLQEIMRTPPSWWPELVLWSEGDIARSYGAAK